MRKLLILLLFLTIKVSGQDTIYVTSKTDSRLKSYNDSLYAYNISRSICENLVPLFRELSNSPDYDDFFNGGWSPMIKNGDPVDTLLGYSEFIVGEEFPDLSQGDQFQSSSKLGNNISYQLRRYDSIKIKCYAKVVGAEMPVIFIYKKPQTVVIWKKLDHCWEKKRFYTTIDIQTYFIVNKMDKTIIPYNIIRYYEANTEHDILKKIEWVDPLNKNKVIKSFSY